jgi:hypothetical protein
VVKRVELTDRIPCGEIESLSKEPGERLLPLHGGGIRHSLTVMSAPNSSSGFLDPSRNKDNFRQPFRPVSDYLKLIKTSRTPQNVAFFRCVMLHFLFAHLSVVVKPSRDSLNRSLRLKKPRTRQYPSLPILQSPGRRAAE